MKADVFILGFLNFLFPVCFFLLFLLFVSSDTQFFKNWKHILKKFIMVLMSAFFANLAKNKGNTKQRLMDIGALHCSA